MSKRLTALRLLAAAVAAAAGVTCSDAGVSGVRQVSGARFALAPAFSQAPEGGPQLEIERIRGVLRNGSDSTVAEARIAGDSAILTFERVQVRGDSSLFQLGVQAFDTGGVVVFETNEPIQVKPGDNPPASPELEYTAPDADVDSLDVIGSVVELEWAGAIPGSLDCLNRAADPAAVTTQQLSVQGFDDADPVADVRVGWTSRDTTVATVDANGIVRSRCSNKSTFVVARTFKDVADSVLVNVTAPPFTLLMNQDSVSVARGADVQLSVKIVDENGNEIPPSEISWHSSDETRATVNGTGLVHGIANGRVQITAEVDGRTTVGIVQVVRPSAEAVIALPGVDTAAVGQLRAFFAKAVDTGNRVIGDASGFVWTSSNPPVASVDESSGRVTANAVGDAFIIATLDGVSDSVEFNVAATRPAGAIRSRIVHAATGAPLAGAVIAGPASDTTSDADGSFTLNGLQPGDDITVTLSGFVSATLFNAPVYPNQTLQLPEAPLIPESASPGSMSGVVKHAITGNGVANIAVNAYTGINAGPSPTRPFATPAATTSTSTGGAWSLGGLPAGVYTLLFKAEGYSEAISVGAVLGGQNTPQEDVLLPPASDASGIAIVLTWGSCGETNVPCDLDLHLTGPTVPDTGRFHVSQSAKTYALDGDTLAALDLGDATGPGPEVIGLRASAAAGTYVLYVRNVSAAADSTSTALSDSAFARVDVYQNNRVIGTFFPPAGQQGTVWKVFEYDGARLKPLNAIVHQDPATLP